MDSHERPDRYDQCAGGICIPATRTAAGKQRRRLLIALGLAGGYVVIEAAGALASGSLALLADAGHMLTDIGVLGLALFAIWFAERPPSTQKSYGYYRAEILAALANAVFLFLVAGFIFYEAYRRLQTPVHVESLPMLGVASVGLLVNLAGLWVLHQGAEESLNVQAAFLEMLGDAASSVGVVIGALVIMTTGFLAIDPILSILIGAFILPRTWGLLNKALNVLLEASPAHIDMGEVRAALATLPGVADVHDLHVWTITAGFEAMSGHVTVRQSADKRELLEDVRRLMRERFGVEHVTIQIEEEPLQERHIAE